MSEVTTVGDMFVEERKLTWADVLAIPAEHLPLIVLSNREATPQDPAGSILSALIKIFSGGSANHSMMMHRPFWFASQDVLFREVPAETYRFATRLKFIDCAEWTPAVRQLMKAEIQADLFPGWNLVRQWMRVYDFLGILGQALRKRWIQSPLNFYCSERVPRNVAWADPEILRLKHPSPDEINTYTKDRQWRPAMWGRPATRRYYVYGRYTDPALE